MPGFCGWSSSFLMSQPEISATAAMAAVAPTIPRARFVCIIIIIVLGGGGSVLEIESEREVRRQAGGLELVLRLRLREPVVRFGVHTPPIRPGVEVAGAEHEARTVGGAQAVVDHSRQLDGRVELAELPELI